MSDKPIKQPKPKGRPPKSKTIFADPPKAEVPQTEPPKAEVPQTEVPKTEPINEIVMPKAEPIAEQKTESVKIPIKIPKKRGKKAEPQGKILTIIDEPIPPKAEAPLPLKVDPPKEVTVVEPPSQKGLKAKKAPKAPKEPKPPKPPKLPKPPKEPKPPKRDEDLYRMVYALQQSLQQTKPKKKVTHYNSTDSDCTSDSDISDDEEPEEKYTRKVQKRLATVQQIEKKLTEARQPKGRYDHLSIF